MEIKRKAFELSVIFVLFGCSLQQAPKPPQPDAGGGPNYELEIQKVVLMNDSDFVKFEDLRVKRYNKTFYVADGSFTMTADFDETWLVESYCWRSKLGNNQWELTAFKTPKQSVCEFVEQFYIPGIQPDVTPFSNMPVYNDGDPFCPFPGGHYTVNNYVADVRNFPPYMQDGTYRIEIMLSKGEEILTGFIIYWKVTPEVG